MGLSDTIRNATDPLGPAAGQRRTVRRGLVALAIAWIAWCYWFSRAALLVMVTLVAGILVLLLARFAVRMLKSGRGVYRYLWLRGLLLLARRVV